MIHYHPLGGTQMFDKLTWYLFILAAILIAAVYYTGVKTDIGAFSAAINSLLDVATGRNQVGQFQGVPPV